MHHPSRQALLCFYTLHTGLQVTAPSMMHLANDVRQTGCRGIGDNITSESITCSHHTIDNDGVASSTDVTMLLPLRLNGHRIQGWNAG